MATEAEHLHLIFPRLNYDPAGLNTNVDIDRGDILQVLGIIQPKLQVTTEFLLADTGPMQLTPSQAWKQARQQPPEWSRVHIGKSYDVAIDLRQVGFENWQGLILPLFFYVATGRQVTAYTPRDLGEDLTAYLDYAKAQSSANFSRAYPPSLPTKVGDYTRAGLH